MQYDDTNRGAVWFNDNKLTDKHPDYSGTLNVEGKIYWLSGWKKKSDAKQNSPLVKFSVKEKIPILNEKKEPLQSINYDDDLPF